MNKVIVQKIFHYFIYINLGLGFLSAIYMVFVVYKIPDASGPLFSAALGLDHEFLVERRLYALEAWVTFGFLAIYFGINRVLSKSE